MQGNTKMLQPSPPVSQTTDRIPPSRLGFDFDGVIADTAEAFLRIACYKYNICDIRVEEITSFEIEQCLYLEQKIIDKIFMEIQLDPVSAGLKPMPDAVEVLIELSGYGQLTVVTARSQAKPVKQWLENVMPKRACSRIRVIASGEHDDKIRHINKHNLTHFIDDRAETCTMLDNAGINPFVFNQPWNVNRHNLPTVNCWQEIRSLCISEGR